MLFNDDDKWNGTLTYVGDCDVHIVEDDMDTTHVM